MPVAPLLDLRTHGRRGRDVQLTANTADVVLEPSPTGATALLRAERLLRSEIHSVLLIVSHSRGGGFEKGGTGRIRFVAQTK